MSDEISRAVHEIQSEAMTLANVLIPGAIESCAWVSLDRYADRLKELVQRGLYHQSLENAKDIAARMSRFYREEEAR
jgi:hypothetical protein